MEQLRRRAATICILVIAAFPSGSARAQQEDSSAPLYSYFLGYAVNLPEQELGFVFGLEQSSLYIDVKVSIGVPGTATDN